MTKASGFAVQHQQFVVTGCCWLTASILQQTLFSWSQNTLFSSDWWLLTLHGLPVSCGSLASFSPLSEYECVDVCVCVYVCVLPRRGGILLRFPPSSPVHLKQSSSHVCHLPISLPLLMLGANLQLSPGCWTKHVSATVLLATIILPVSVFCGETLVVLMLWSRLKSWQFVL